MSAPDETGRLEGVGGLTIFWQAWRPEAHPRAVVVLAHGASEHSARYGHVAARLTGEKLALYALDHRGHGRSAGRRAHIDRMAHVVADLAALLDIAAERHPGVPLYLLGHSVGGCVALSYALEHQDRLDGLILSAPVAALETASPVTRLLASVLSMLLPALPVFAVDATTVSRDPEVVRDYEEDPLVHHGKLSARTVAEIAGAVERFPDAVPSLELPLLAMHGTADTLVPLAGTEMVHERAGSRDKRLELYVGLYHEILNEPERDRVIDDVVGWISEHARVGRRAAGNPA